MRRSSAPLVTLLAALAVALVFATPGLDPRLKNASRAVERGGWIQVRLEGAPGEIGFMRGSRPRQKSGQPGDCGRGAAEVHLLGRLH
jgi:hypothetical protein